MKNGRINIGSIRREQIVEAAAAVIAEQGIQNLSLSEIEQKVRTATLTLALPKPRAGSRSSVSAFPSMTRR